MTQGAEGGAGDCPRQGERDQPQEGRPGEAAGGGSCWTGDTLVSSSVDDGIMDSMDKSKMAVLGFFSR